ncbi:MAG: hypothetical protein K6B28_08275 [Lachnospiraceae bacterium]|nr:hypothetical protein [Lachnospiraceae bacterium]
MADNSIFRKESLERIQSPEQINDYLKVTGPSVWVTLGAVVLLLIGALIWGVTGELDTFVNASVVSDGTKTVCYIISHEAKDVRVGMPVKIEGEEYTIESIDPTPKDADKILDEYMIYSTNLDEDDWIYEAKISEVFPAGVYSGQIVIDRLKPIDLLMKK